MKVGVVGVGSMGEAHARVYAGLPAAELAVVCDTDRDRGREVAERYGARTVADYRELEGDLDAVSVAVPTLLHAEVSEFFLTKGVSVLVEKPMARTSKEAAALVEAACRSSATLMVGHIERFNPAFMAIREMDFQPLFIECDRISPFRFRSSDVGVVFDLMIHDIDIILSLARSEVERIDACAVPVLADSEDICNARFAFRNGCVANVTASRVSTKSMRKIRLFSRDAYVTIDYAARKALIYRKSPKLTLDAARALKDGAMSLADFAGMSFPELLDIRNVALDDHEPLAKELEAFLKAVASGGEPPVTGRDGLEAVTIAEHVLASAKAHRSRVDN
ncbi:MAG: Gfo/Idh/MocA family oxidoreductase [Planctomycetota bacterium]|jgi:predicted dehydrogenase